MLTAMKKLKKKRGRKGDGETAGGGRQVAVLISVVREAPEKVTM